MVASPDELQAFAEDPGVFVRLGPDEGRIRTARYCVAFAPGVHAWSTSVLRLRLGDDVDAAVDGVRSLLAARGRGAATWLTGPSSRPPGLVDRLLGAGMEHEDPEGSSIMVLGRPPASRPSFEVRRASTYADLRATIEVAIRGFGFADRDADDERRRARATFESERSGGHTFRLLAVDGERPVATLRAWRSPAGLYLGGAATLPADRGRGAMTALVGAAWRDAVRDGTPALVAHGNRRSTPLFERIGFRSHGLVHHLIDAG